MIEIAPSILSADFGHLAEQVTAALDWGARRIHVDVMDGRFVPNISIGPLVAEAIAPLLRARKAFMEVHLMIVEPERYLADFARAGADMLQVHVETCPHLHRTIQQIKELGVAAGVVINPATSLSALDEILPDVDQVLLMTVNPGFGGQKFIEGSLAKIQRLAEMLKQRGLSQIPIEVDGGVSVGTIRQIQAAGATIAVAGSSVFNRDGSVAKNLDALMAACVNK